MAFYMDEEQAWKCRKHPSKRRRTGICPKCLHERLLTLCPNCANALPCACCPPPADSSSSSSSSSAASFSLFSFSRGGSRHDFATAHGDPSRLSNNLDADPALRKSRSVAISFLRSRSRYVGNGNGNGNGNGGCEIEVAANGNKLLPPKVSRSRGNFWSFFTVNRSKKCDVHAQEPEEELNNTDGVAAVDDSPNPMMMRSRSAAVGAGNRISPATSKRKGWYFPSPINAFRYSKSPRSVTVT